MGEAVSSDYGIPYTPESSPQSSLTLADLEANYKYVRVHWLDLASCLGMRVVPVSHFLRLLKNPRPGVCLITATLKLFLLHPAPGTVAFGEYIYVFDEASLRPCPYAKGHASVLGFFQEKVIIGKQLAAPLCPRSLLKGILDDAASIGITYLTGFEIEFMLLKFDELGDFDPVKVQGLSSSASLSGDLIQAKVLEEIADGVQAAGIQLDDYHAESSLGQFEIVTGPLPPLQAIDALVLTRELVYQTASKYGLRATLAPRPFPKLTGNSLHTHISIHSTSPADPNSLSNGTTMQPHEASFLGSVLDHLPALCAFTLPTEASYARVKDGMRSGGTYVCWGSNDNREAPLRLCGSPGSHHIEYKHLDGTAQPYLAMAAILGVGTDGIKNKAPLLYKDAGIPIDNMSETERAAFGELGRLPPTRVAAAVALEQDDTMKSIFPPALLDMYAKVCKVRDQHLQEGSDDEKTSRLVQTY